MAQGTPEAEVDIDATLIRALLAEQHPDLAHEPIAMMDAGWDNAMARIGNDLAIRLPRRTMAVPFLEAEQAWLPTIADQLPIAVPTPERTGVAGALFPWPWSILPWLDGTTAYREPLHNDQALPLAEFLGALHKPAPKNAPRNHMRGVPLETRIIDLNPRMDRLRRKTDYLTSAIERAWQLALAAPAAELEVWVHGDLHARNVLVREGQLCGVIDWGDITVGDPATDLACLWMLLDEPAARQSALSAYEIEDQALVQRAIGWAILFGVLLLDTGLVDHAEHAAMGADTLRRVEEDVNHSTV